MKAGAARVDITPEPGVQMSGYANRTQPSIGAHDPLYACGLYLERDGERLLWINADLIAFERRFVDDFRNWALDRLGLEPRQVLLTATHTHAGPATIDLINAGSYETAYVASLRERLESLARETVRTPRAVRTVAAEARSDQARDRRNHEPTAHVDPRLPVIGLRCDGGDYLAVLTGYGMHNVMLGGDNRRFSADVLGFAGRALAERLPGRPHVLWTAGACGNINPRVRDRGDFVAVREKADELARTVAEALDRADALEPATLRTGLTRVTMPLDVMTPDRMREHVREMDDAPAVVDTPVGRRIRDAHRKWLASMTEACERDALPNDVEVDLAVVAIGRMIFVGVAAEIFSRFSDAVAQRAGRNVYTVGLANGDVGYVPTAESYPVGGYEVDHAFMFYHSFRPRRGAFERLADRAADLLERVLQT